MSYPSKLVNACFLRCSDATRKNRSAIRLLATRCASIFTKQVKIYGNIAVSVTPV